MSGVLLRIFQLIKETYYVNTFQDSLDMSLFISLKANFDLFLVLTSSVYFLESCYSKKKINIPIVPIIGSLILGVLIYFYKFQILNSFDIFFLVLFGSIITVFSNCVVILSKESKNLKYNFIANGFENYFLIFLILIFIIIEIEPSFIFLTYILITTQFFISIIIYNKLKAYKLYIKFNFRIKDSIMVIPQIIGSTFVLLVMIIARTLFDLNTDIIISNYSLIIASAPLLLFERYHEYSSNKNFIIYNWIVVSLILVFVMNSALLIFYDQIKDLMIYGNIGIILLNSLKFFLILFPVFIFFSLCKKYKNFNNLVIFILFSSYLLSLLFESFYSISDIFLFISSTLSIIIFIMYYEPKNKT